jgi:hypothetical protein
MPETPTNEPTSYLDKNPAYQDVVSFSKNADIQEGVDYSWVWDYASASYDRASTLYRSLDDKANDIIKYLGGGTGLFTLGLLNGIHKGNVWYFACALPSIIFALISVFLAALARKPGHTVHPPSIQDAWRFAEHFETKDKARAAFVGQWAVAAEARYLSAQRKAEYVKYATWMFFVALALLLIPFVYAILHPIPAPKP